MPISETIDQELDCRGLGCPLPIIKTKLAMDKLDGGQVLKMTATDPGSVNDMTAWTAKTGHELLGSEQTGDDYIYYLRKVG